MILSIIKLIRLPQWIKNLFLFVPLLFSLHFFHEDYFVTVLQGFFVFCLSSSFVYVINDIADAEADRLHPTKKNRPIASGAISVKQGLIISFTLLAIIFISLVFFNFLFNLLVLVFLILNIVYSFYLKHVVILDIFSIAAGFSIRVIAGAFIIDVEISSWLILTTMFISLFLAVMKRYSELSHALENSTNSSRKVLGEYSKDFTNQMATVAAAGVIICYALYTVSERTVEVFKTENLIYTTPFVVFGIFRYMYLVYRFDKGENTTKIMVTDLPMITTVISYLIVTGIIIYKFI